MAGFDSESKEHSETVSFCSYSFLAKAFSLLDHQICLIYVCHPPHINAEIDDEKNGNHE